MTSALRSPHPSESTIQDELSTALRDHQSGRLEQAARTYQSILAQHSDHADALHLLGVVALQQGMPRRAVELIGRAIAANPSAEKRGKEDAARMAWRPDDPAPAGSGRKFFPAGS